MSSVSPKPEPASDQEALLAALRAVLDELGRRVPPEAVHLDARLDADLGLDSLTRVELLARVEQSFGVRVPDRVIAEVETPRELLQAIRAAGEQRPGGAQAAAPAVEVVPDSGPVRTAPEDTPTLVDALEWHVREHPDRVHVYVYEEDDRVTSLTYRGLMDAALPLAGGLVERGLRQGECVAIMLPTGQDYLASFMAVLLAGGTPVPIYPPARVKQIQEHFQRHARILDNARARMIITFDEVKQVTRLLTARVPGLEELLTPGDLAASPPLELRPAVTPEQVAFLQYTSGSTGDPKGVVLTHRNILASLRSMRRALEVTPADVFVSWLPLYHDMGLIGAWLGALVVGFPLVLMSPLTFLARPERWLQVIQRFGGTVSGGPNFAYELCHRRIADDALEGMDLSSWRLAFSGAEPVSPQTMARFVERFQPVGFDPLAMTPVYGLAEATLGVAFTPVGRGPRLDCIDRERFHREGVARPVENDDDGLRVVSNGVAIPDFEVRVVGDDGHECVDREEGEVQFRGPGCTSGYNRNPEATRSLFVGDWVRSGDRGYLADGELYITGRDKDVVIRAGRNLYPYALEQAVADVDGVRRGCVAVFGGDDPASGTERLVVLAETREEDPARLAAMSDAIRELTLEHLGLPADEVLLVPPQTVLKTSSGKIRRAALARRFTEGRLTEQAAAPWQQLLRLGVESLLPAMRGALRRLARWAYTLWFWLVLGLNVLWVWPAVVLLPGRRLPWSAARAASRVFLAAAGIRLTVEGGPGPGKGPGMLLANHQSYLDGLVLIAALARPVAFVAKRELAAHPFAGPFLKALGVLYVERFDRQGSLEDARGIRTALAGDERVAFFPEGTFHRMPGLLPFQLGAFDAAVAVGGVVWPVVLSGTRDVLRGDELFPRRGSVRVQFLEPLDVAAVSESQRWSAAVQLRDRVRERMLAASREPDLAARDALAELAARRGGGVGP